MKTLSISAIVRKWVICCPPNPLFWAANKRLCVLCQTARCCVTSDIKPAPKPDSVSTLPPPFVSSRWSTDCTVPTTLCKQRPTAPSTVWSIPLTLHWWICGTRGRWRPIRRRPEASWVCQRWWSRASVFPLERRQWEQNTPRCWSNMRRRRSRWGEGRVRLHKITSSLFKFLSVSCWGSSVSACASAFIPLTRVTSSVVVITPDLAHYILKIYFYLLGMD